MGGKQNTSRTKVMSVQPLKGALWMKMILLVCLLVSLISCFYHWNKKIIMILNIKIYNHVWVKSKIIIIIIKEN